VGCKGRNTAHRVGDGLSAAGAQPLLTKLVTKFQCILARLPPGPTRLVFDLIRNGAEQNMLRFYTAGLARKRYTPIGTQGGAKAKH